MASAIRRESALTIGQAAGTAGVKLVERPEPQAAINDVVVQIHALQPSSVVVVPVRSPVSSRDLGLVADLLRSCGWQDTGTVRSCTGITADAFIDGRLLGTYHRVDGCVGKSSLVDCKLFASIHSSRSRIIGSTARARRAGTKAATTPTQSIVRMTPPRMTGSFGVA
jgi:hypothetical protein